MYAIGGSRQKKRANDNVFIFRVGNAILFVVRRSAHV